MAKLSAHGSEIARLHRNFPRPKDPDFASEDIYLSLRTDGFVLERRALNWHDGQRHPGSWRIQSKIKAATGAERRERIPAIFPKLIRNLTGKGYTLKEGPAFSKVRDHLEPDGNDDTPPESA